MNRRLADAILKAYRDMPHMMRFTCGSEAEMHHPDYSKPLEIVWLCRDHHLALHTEAA